MIYAVAKVVMTGVTRIYFRSLEQVGAPGPEVAGRLFAANHFNGLVDPLVFLVAADFTASPIAKSTLFSTPGLKQLLWIADAVPILRRKDAPDKASGGNEAVFDRVADHLGRGGNLLIFPEGVSHTEPHVLPVKTGAARMLARAHERGARGLTLQAVALDFDARDTFRSRALVTYGPVHEVDEVAGRAGAGEPLVHALTELIARDLGELVVQGESRGELLRIREIAEILAASSRHEARDHGAPREAGTLDARAVIAREAFARAREVDPERYQAVVEAVDRYVHARAALGLTEEQVARGQEVLDPRRLLRAFLLSLSAPLALVGALLYQLPYRLPRLVAARLSQGEGDVISSYKLGVALLAFPIWIGALIAAALALVHPAWGRLACVALIVASPLCSIVWIDRLDDRRGRRFLTTASTAGVKELARLRLLRSHAVDAILAARKP